MRTAETRRLTSWACEPLATMTPVALLVWFCAVMGAIAAVRFVLADERDPVDAGVILIVWGITVLAALWATLEEGLFAIAGHIALAVGGLVLVGGGILVIAIYWHQPPRRRAGPSQRTDAGSRDESTDSDASSEHS